MFIPVILVNWNGESNITDDAIIRIQKDKKRKLEENIILINKEKFIEYIKNLTPLKIAQ